MIIPRSGRPEHRALKGEYLARNPALNLGLAAIDAGLRLFSAAPGAPIAALPPRKVLIAVGGHLGDAIMATAILPIIRTGWPAAEIGVLIGSWAKPALDGHPLVSYIHEFNHWRTNRGSDGPLRRTRSYVRTRRRSVREIATVGYDAAIDLNPYFPNAIPLLWHAGVPVRVGFTSGGFGPLLTHTVEWLDTPRHRVAYHLDLLRRAGLSVDGMPNRYALFLQPAAHPIDRHPAGSYLVLHTGAGLSIKEWPEDRWEGLVRRLLEKGYRIVFTGAGTDETERAERLAGEHKGCINLCGKLEWHGFVETIANARALICVDSAAGHVAASVDTPVVVLISGMNRTEHWAPLGEDVSPLTHAVPCAPCFRSRGCAGMECVREISVDEVIFELSRLLERAELPVRTVTPGAASSP